MIKVELLSKKDQFFIYEHEADVFDYEDMKERQHLNPQFCDYLTVLIKLFNQSIVSRDTHKCQMQLNADNSGDLFFNQILPYKQLELLGCHFTQKHEDRVH